MSRHDDDVLGADPRPAAFRVVDPAPGLGRPLAPADPGRVTVRTWGRSLAGMQKEVLVATSSDDALWRLTSDEGGDLNGHDQAPFPLGHMSTGLAASCAGEVAALAAQRGVEVAGLRVVLDSRYTMEGSALRGTMVGGALAPEVRVEARSELDPAAFRLLVCDALGVSTAAGLLRGGLPGRFSLSVNGRRLETGSTVEGELARPPEDRLDALAPDQGRYLARPVLDKGAPEPVEGRAVDGAGGLQAVQSRVLRVRATCSVREDGVKSVTQQLLAPAGGSAWTSLCDEAPSAGGLGRAPDAAGYMAAGLAFCFLTQLGRYAAITRRDLTGYAVVQDLELPVGGATTGSGTAGAAGPVVTSVFLATGEDDAFARTALAMGEQTCFLHALCGTPLTLRVAARLVD